MKTFVLDFDGTLADTRNSVVHTVQETLRTLGLPPAGPEEIQPLIGLPLRDTFVRAARLTDESMLVRAMQIYRELYGTICLETVGLFPGVEPALQQLHRKGITLTVASSKGKEALSTLLEKLGISKYIILILGEEDVQSKKPAPEMVRSILVQTGTSPAETLVVGDTVYDIVMGQAAHCVTCAVTYGNHTRVQLEAQRPDHLADCFQDLILLADL